mgnify:FL=1
MVRAGGILRRFMLVIFVAKNLWAFGVNLCYLLENTWYKTKFMWGGINYGVGVISLKTQALASKL